MTTDEALKLFNTINITQERQIDAPIDVVFATVLEPQGPLADMGVKLEPWPGGRWFRDLGNNTGHLWGHVQVIKPPKLLEITGPMFMSYPVASFIQYRLSENAGGTKLQFLHQAFGMIPPDHKEGVTKGWNQMLDAILAKSQSRAGGVKIA